MRKSYVSQTRVSQTHDPQIFKTNMICKSIISCLRRIVSCKGTATVSTIGGFSRFSFKQHLSFLEVFDFPQHEVPEVYFFTLDQCMTLLKAIM